MKGRHRVQCQDMRILRRKSTYYVIRRQSGGGARMLDSSGDDGRSKRMKVFERC